MALAATAVLGVAAMGIGMSVAGAVDYPATTGTLTVTEGGSTATTVQPGSTVVVGGGGCAPGAAVTVTIASTPTTLANVSAGSTGSFSVPVTIPQNIEGGTHTLTATCVAVDGGTITLTQQVTVAGATALAFTGGNAGQLVAIALGALAVGALFVTVTRRRAGQAA
jgi:adhesin/invasin